MPSSTFNFSRSIPPQPWGRVLAVTAALVLGATGAWEFVCRRQGYRPTLNDTRDLWASQRKALREAEPDATVIIGASRARFDLDLDQLAAVSGGRKPIQLAINGGVAPLMLHALAEDETFRGTVLAGVVPGLFFTGGGPQLKKTIDWLAYAETWSPSQRFGHEIAKMLQWRLAFIQQQDLTLTQLLGALPIPNRPAAKVSPTLPPYLATVGADRGQHMIEKLERDPAYQERVKQIWLGLFKRPPPIRPETVERVLAKVAADVARITARGGRVVFLRMPSTGRLRALEHERTPRAAYWDRILKATGAPGIHFEDEPDLAGFSCPEWSHLTVEDSRLFTARLIPKLRRVLR